MSRLSQLAWPGPPAEQKAQDKRSVIPLAPEEYDQSLAGNQAEAGQLMQVPPLEWFEAGPVEAHALRTLFEQSAGL